MPDNERMCLWRFHLTTGKIETRREYYERQRFYGGIKRLPNDLLPPEHRVVDIPVEHQGVAGTVRCHEEPEVY